ncbi:MAG: PTS sugar transporter subunit IIB [Deltaproteobacteria bacterium]|jgi:mannose/fructose/N-acetylgalactosamine-specific phosphotransferase system component IIB|nr:PTS sugar transporter subunit IIB [Deltaproteobacteria bacterium]
MPIVLARIDQRFIHGQILASAALAKRKVNGVIVADTALSGDGLRQGIFDGALSAADPPLGGAHYVDPARLAELLRERDSKGKRFLLIFGDVGGVLQALSDGVPIESLNLGNYCTRSEDPVELYQGFRLGPSEIRELDEIAGRVSRIYFGPLDESRKAYTPRPGPRPPRPESQ